jgi:hypothetical protein
MNKITHLGFLVALASTLLLQVLKCQAATSRFTVSVKNAGGVQYTLSIYANDERIRREGSSTSMYDEGDRVASGHYQITLFRKGWPSAKRQNVTLHYKPNTLLNFNLKRKMVYVMPGRAKGEPDMLIIEQHGNSNFNYARVFIVERDKLVGVKFQASKSEYFYDAEWARDGGFKRVGTLRYQIGIHNPFSGWHESSWIFHPKQRTLTRTNTSGSR